MSDRERRVRDEAYRIWDEAGRPEGRESEHWYEAEKRIPQDGSGEPAAAKAKAPKSVKPVVRSAANSGVATPAANDAAKRAPKKGAAVDVAPVGSKVAKPKADGPAKPVKSKPKT